MNESARQQDSPGVVAIGRNEGERLSRCLDSLLGKAAVIVYVDSGSTDGSVEMARGKGVEVVELDMSVPFTMARGRNAGFARLKEIAPDVGLVQLVDGDCEVMDGWIERAVEALNERPDVGAVCGHRRERYRDATIYNRLTDMDWRGPIGEVRFCGGDVMMRAAAFERVGGYNERMIAGEDPEICVRLRQAGWTMLRLDADMTLHDAAMTRLGQWWRRTVRTGHAYAEGAALHRKSPERPWRRETRRNWFWGVAMPAASAGLALPTGGWSLAAMGLYPLWVARIARQRQKRQGDRPSDAWLYASFNMLGKFPQAYGQLLYGWRRIRGHRPQLIEYKNVERVSQR